MKYLITGVDGKLSRRVADNMITLVNPKNLIFTCPDLKKIPKNTITYWNSLGIILKEANYDDIPQMIEAFSGADRIFFISSILNGPKRITQHKNVIEACKKAHIKHITYTSFLGADNPNYTQYVIPDHRETEKMIKNSGIEYNIMRNNLYMENYLTTSVMLAMLSNNIWGTTAGEGKVSCIAKDDSALCATNLLLGKGEPNKAYNLTSSKAVSQREICDLISKKSGIPFIYQPMSKEEFLIYLKNLHIPETTDGDFSNSPVPFCSNDMITNEAGISENKMAIITNDVEILTGKKPLEVEDLIDKYSYVWKKNIKSWKEMF